MGGINRQAVEQRGDLHAYEDKYKGAKHERYHFPHRLGRHAEFRRKGRGRMPADIKACGNHRQHARAMHAFGQNIRQVGYHQ